MSKKKKIWLTVAAILLVIVGGAWLYWRSLDAQDQNLTPEERVVKNFVRGADPESGTVERFHALVRGQSELQQMTPETRKVVIVNSIVTATTVTLEDFSALPEEKKAARAQALYEDAVNTRDFFNKQSRDNQRKAQDVMRSADGRAAFDEAVKTVMIKLSPADRERLAPTLKIWQTMLERK